MDDGDVNTTLLLVHRLQHLSGRLLPSCRFATDPYFLFLVPLDLHMYNNTRTLASCAASQPSCQDKNSDVRSTYILQDNLTAQWRVMQCSVPAAAIGIPTHYRSHNYDVQICTDNSANMPNRSVAPGPFYSNEKSKSK